MPRSARLAARMRRMALFALSIGCWAVPGRSQTPIFRDVTAESGITFSHHSAPEKRYIAESVPGGLALLDYDRDGWLDLYLLNSLTIETIDQPELAESHFYRNRRDGTFENVTQRLGAGYPGWAVGVCAGDYDADGWPDLYVTGFGDNRLYRNQGGETFRDVAGAAGVNDRRFSAGCAFGDYDNDGDLDLFVANYVTLDPDRLPKFGEGSHCQFRGVPVQCGPSGLPGAGDSLYRNEGNGTFSDVSQAAGVSDPAGYYGMGVVWTDFDQDGWVDLFVANDTRANYLYRNNRDGTFEEIAFLTGMALGLHGDEQGSMGIAVGDYDHDQKLDLFVTNFENQNNVLYRNMGEFLTSNTSYSSGAAASSSLPLVGWGTDFIDFDNDGWADLLTVNGHIYPQVDQPDSPMSYAQPMQLFRNRRDGTFAEVAADEIEVLTRKRSSRGAAFGDLDNDGDIDVVVNNLDGAPLLLRNELGNRNNWIRVEVLGLAGNRFAIGARVKVVAGDLVQVAEVRSGGSYISQNDWRLHFGLGEKSRVDSIEVRWPGGAVRQVKGIAANRQITIEPPQ